MKTTDEQDRVLTRGELLQLKRWNTPTIYNGWECITQHDIAKDAVNLEPTVDYMPQMGPMVGYAVTLQVEPSNPDHREANPGAHRAYLEYIANIEGPKIVVVQDLDKPKTYGSFWGEVSSNVHRSLGCVGCLVDGAVRDIDEMTSAGFKALARRLCVGHAHAWPVSWGQEVEVFGRAVKPGDLIHADKHGFLAVPLEDQTRVLEAATFMDTNECKTVLDVACDGVGHATHDIVASVIESNQRYGSFIKRQFNQTGEW